MLRGRGHDAIGARPVQDRGFNALLVIVLLDLGVGVAAFSLSSTTVAGGMHMGTIYRADGEYVWTVFLTTPPKALTYSSSS